MKRPRVSWTVPQLGVYFLTFVAPSGAIHPVKRGATIVIGAADTHEVSPDGCGFVYSSKFSARLSFGGLRALTV